MLVKCKCGAQLAIAGNDSSDSAQKEKLLRIIRAVWNRRRTTLDASEWNYADDLRDAFNAGLNRAAEIVLDEYNPNLSEKELVEAIRMAMKP